MYAYLAIGLVTIWSNWKQVRKQVARRLVIPVLANQNFWLFNNWSIVASLSVIRIQMEFPMPDNYIYRAWIHLEYALAFRVDVHCTYIYGRWNGKGNQIK